LTSKAKQNHARVINKQINLVGERLKLNIHQNNQFLSCWRLIRSIYHRERPVRNVNKVRIGCVLMNF